MRKIVVSESDNKSAPIGYSWKFNGCVRGYSVRSSGVAMQIKHDDFNTLTEARNHARSIVRNGKTWAEVFRWAESGAGIKAVLIAYYDVEIESGIMRKECSMKFFLEHAGFSYDPKTETREQGRARCAKGLSTAEDVLMQAMRVGDVSVTWDADERQGDEPDDIECVECCMIKISGKIVASLFGIWDADANYKRVIRAELSTECLNQLNEVIA